MIPGRGPASDNGGSLRKSRRVQQHLSGSELHQGGVPFAVLRSFHTVDFSGHGPMAPHGCRDLAMFSFGGLAGYDAGARAAFDFARNPTVFAAHRSERDFKGKRASGGVGDFGGTDPLRIQTCSNFARGRSRFFRSARM